MTKPRTPTSVSPVGEVVQPSRRRQLRRCPTRCPYRASGGVPGSVAVLLRPLEHGGGRVQRTAPHGHQRRRECRVSARPHRYGDGPHAEEVTLVRRNPRGPRAGGLAHAGAMRRRTLRAGLGEGAPLAVVREEVPAWREGPRGRRRRSCNGGSPALLLLLEGEQVLEAGAAVPMRGRLAAAAKEVPRSPLAAWCGATFRGGGRLLRTSQHPRRFRRPHVEREGGRGRGRYSRHGGAGGLRRDLAGATGRTRGAPRQGGLRQGGHAL